MVGAPGGTTTERSSCGRTSTLHVDRWIGSAFVADYHVFTVADDHFARGRFTAVANDLGRRRGMLRVTAVLNMPVGALTVVKDPEWSSDWKLFQRDACDHADIPVRVVDREAIAPARARSSLSRPHAVVAPALHHHA